MDPPRTYTFSASMPILSNSATRLTFRPPEAPDIVAGAVPTITRQFCSVGRVKQEIPDIDLLYSIAHKPRSYKSATPSCVTAERGHTLSFKVPPSPSPEPPSVISPASGCTYSATPSLTGTNTPGPSRSNNRRLNTFGDFLPSPHLTRSASRPSLRGEGDTPLRSSSAARSSSPFNLQNLQREVFKCMPTDEEKAKKIEPRPMYVFLLDNDEELDEPPPQLALRPDLEVDDVVCNRPLTSNPQLWVWSPTGRGSSSWKAVLRGYTRGSDGRRLNLSGDPLRPVWIGDEWYRKLLRKEKAADHLRSVQGKTQGKGNQRA